MLTKDLAICIRAVDYSETSQIATFFTQRTGKISAIAKGSKRAKSRSGGAIEIFSFGQIVFTSTGGEKLATLAEFEQRSAFFNLSNNLYALNCSLLAVELVGHLTNEYDPHPELFDFFHQFLNNVQSTKDRPDTLVLLILFQLSLLKEVGLQPVLNACINCRNNFSSNWPQTYFSSSGNGLVCRDCEASFTDKIRLSKESANYLADLRSIGQANEKMLTEIERILLRHFTNMLHHAPKMAKYVL